MFHFLLPRQFGSGVKNTVDSNKPGSDSRL